MSRDDSMLYAGSSSAAFTHKEQDVVKNRRDKKHEKKQQLQPVAEFIFQEIENEKKSVMYIKNIDITNVQDEKMFMVEMMARRKYVDYLDQLKLKLTIILREKK